MAEISQNFFLFSRTCPLFKFSDGRSKYIKNPADNCLEKNSYEFLGLVQGIKRDFCPKLTNGTKMMIINSWFARLSTARGAKYEVLPGGSH